MSELKNRCLHCSAGTTNGLALCNLCRTYTSELLERMPVYIRNLARQRRPGRPNGSLGVSGQWLIRRGEVDGSKVEAALNWAFNTLDTWAECLRDDRSVELPQHDTDAATAVALCAFLEQHLTSIATLEWAGQFVKDIVRHTEALERLTLSEVPGWYAGACRQITGRDMEGNVYECGTDTYVIPGLTWVTCTGCGATTHAADHLDVILDEARDWRAGANAIAEALVALVATEESVPRLRRRIRQWGTRGKLPAWHRMTRDYAYDEDSGQVAVVDVAAGGARYLLGDVLDRLLSEGATRADLLASEGRDCS